MKRRLWMMGSIFVQDISMPLHGKPFNLDKLLHRGEYALSENTELTDDGWVEDGAEEA